MSGFIISGYWRSRKGTDEELFRQLRKTFLSDSLADLKWFPKGRSNKKNRPIDFSTDLSIHALIDSGINRNFDGEEIREIGRSIALWSQSELLTAECSIHYGAESLNVLNCYILKIDTCQVGTPQIVDLESVFRCLISVWSPEVAVLCSKEFFYDRNIGLADTPTDWLAYSIRSNQQNSDDRGVNFHQGSITSNTS